MARIKAELRAQVPVQAAHELHKPGEFKYTGAQISPTLNPKDQFIVTYQPAAELRESCPVKGHGNDVIHRVVGTHNFTTGLVTPAGLPTPPSENPDAPFTELMDRIELLVKTGAIAAQTVPAIIAAVPGAVNLSNVSKVWKKKPEVLTAVHAAVDAALRGA